MNRIEVGAIATKTSPLRAALESEDGFRRSNPKAKPLQVLDQFDASPSDSFAWVELGWIYLPISQQLFLSLHS